MLVIHGDELHLAGIDVLADLLQRVPGEVHFLRHHNLLRGDEPLSRATLLRQGLGIRFGVDRIFYLQAASWWTLGLVLLSTVLSVATPIRIW